MINPQTQQLIGRAIECFQNGSPQQAEEILVRILNTQSNNLPALEILGLIKATQGNHLESAKLLKKAVKLNPQNPATQYNLAKALSEGRDYVGSLIHHEKALQLAPNNPDGWLNYGQTLANLQRHEQALTAFNNALSINPHNAKVWLDMSTSLGILQRYDDAIGCCDQALAVHPNLPEAWLNKGSAYSELKQFAQAVDCYQKAVDLKPNYADAWYSKGIALEKLDHYQEALGCYDKAIEIYPNHAKAWLNRGCAQNYLTNYQGAIDSFNRSINLQPVNVEAWANKAVSLYELREFEDAFNCCNKALEIDTTFDDAHLSKSFCELMQGNFEAGFINYESRWRKKNSDQYLYPNIPQLPSLEAAHGKKILVWSEQGFGDTLQFARYIPLLTQLEIKPIFEIQAPLAALLKNQYECALISKDEPIGDVDFQTPLLSLPLLFKTDLKTIPTNIPYIRVAPQKKAEWTSKLPLSHEKINIGIACSGNQNFDIKNGNKRPIPLHYFSALSKQCNLFLIQKELLDSDKDILSSLVNIHPMGDLMENFEDSAAIVENMDLIISIDTSLAHLAGALGKKVFVLLPWCSDWRWLATGTTNPWYPTATLFRQSSWGDWQSVITEVEKVLVGINIPK